MPDLSVALSFGNCRAHGTGSVEATCSYSGKLLCIDISNEIAALPGATTSCARPHLAAAAHTEASPKTSDLSQFSTGLGLKDLKVICGKLGIRYEAGSTDSGLRWHSTIYLEARPITAAMAGQESAALSNSPQQQPPAAVVDAPATMAAAPSTTPGYSRASDAAAAKRVAVRLPNQAHVAIFDDQRMIPRLMRMKIQRTFPNVRVSVVQLCFVD